MLYIVFRKVWKQLICCINFYFLFFLITKLSYLNKTIISRFVRREKEIAETKAEASETESMRYRQRAEHLQRDLDESKTALELEQQRTKGRMLTEDEHNELLEKVKKMKEFEELNKNLEKEAFEFDKKQKMFMEKVPIHSLCNIVFLLWSHTPQILLTHTALRTHSLTHSRVHAHACTHTHVHIFKINTNFHIKTSTNLLMLTIQNSS